MKLRLYGALTVISLTSFAAHASCPLEHDRPAERIRSSNAIFWAEIISARNEPDRELQGYGKGRAQPTQVKILRSWKGDLRGIIEVMHLTDSECPVDFRMLVGRQIVFFARRTSDGLLTHFSEYSPPFGRERRSYERFLPGIVGAWAQAERHNEQKRGRLPKTE